MISTAKEMVPRRNQHERKMLKAFLLGRLYELFSELFRGKIENQHNFYMECYAMDSKIIQLLIQDIVETGEYTLEGIAYHTHIPFDIIYEAASGISNQLSIAPWAKVVDLYIQVKPDIEQALVNRFLEIKNRNGSSISLLLNEA